MWQVTLGGKVVKFDDLPPAVLQEIASKHGQHWMDVFSSPVAHLDAFCDVVRECAKRLEVDPPDLSTMGAVRRVANDALERAADDLPAEFEEGLPLAEDEPTTG